MPGRAAVDCTGEAAAGADTTANPVGNLEKITKRPTAIPVGNGTPVLGYHLGRTHIVTVEKSAGATDTPPYLLIDNTAGTLSAVG